MRIPFLRKLLLLTALASGFSACGTELPTPFPPQAVRSPPVSELMSESEGRLRISIASEEVEADSGVQLGRVIACSQIACHESPTPAQVDLANTSKGKATFLVDMAVPRQDIRELIFVDPGRSKSIAGRIKLTDRGYLAAPFQGAEIFVLMKKVKDAGRQLYVPDQVASFYYPVEPQTMIYYDPKYPAEIESLKFGARLSIPAASTEKPQIFSLSLSDIGKAFPALDVIPEMPLRKPWSIEIVELMKPWKEPGYNGPPPIVAHKFKSKAVRPFMETGVLARFVQRLDRAGYFTFEPSDDRSSYQGALSCGQALKESLARQDMSLPPGVEYLDSCVNVPPYVHIAKARLDDSRRWLYIRSQSSSYIDNMIALDLQPITNFSTASAVAINGFTWSGDSGVSGGKGLANGYVASNETHIGDNRAGGGHSKTAPGDSAGNKLIFRWNREGQFVWEEKSDSSLLSLSKYPNHVSSSTSVIKRGLCSNDSTTERWSAIGTSPDGVLVFMSSTSAGQTSAKDLCPLFQALGVDNAIRLDGSSAAGIVVGGDLLNPLVGFDKALMGELRDIAYAVTLR